MVKLLVFFIIYTGTNSLRKNIYFNWESLKGIFTTVFIVEKNVY